MVSGVSLGEGVSTGRVGKSQERGLVRLEVKGRPHVMTVSAGTTMGECARCDSCANVWAGMTV